MSRALALGLVLASLGGAAVGQQVSVQSLLSQGFTVVGTAPSVSGGGVGVFLQNKDKLFYCLVAETSASTTVATRYCKPVQ
jgi:hypothetical protein